MDQKTNRAELERRLEQAKRHASSPVDPLTKELLQALVVDIEGQIATAKALDGEAGQ